MGFYSFIHIVMYDLGSDGIYGTDDDSGEQQITTDQKMNVNPQIFKNKIVWENDFRGNSDIYMYDLGNDGVYGTDDDSGEQQITTDLFTQIQPFIFEDKIVWDDSRNGNSDIYMYELAEEPTI